MKSFFIVESKDAEAFLEDWTPRLMANELTLIGFSPQLSDEYKERILQTSAEKCQRLALRLPYQEILEQGSLFQIAQRAGVNYYVPRLPLMAPETNVEDLVTRSFRPIEKAETVKYYDRILEIMRVDSLLPEIELDSSNIDYLYSNIREMFSRGTESVFINPKNLDPKNYADKTKEQLELLTMYYDTPGFVYFTPSHPHHEIWEACTLNVLRGPRVVEIDTTNQCTHNCVFCGLYNQEIQDKYVEQGGGELPSEIKELYNKKIGRENCLNLINSLSDKVEQIIFGGMGDPFTHPNIIEFIEAARLRGIRVTVYANFAYMNEEKMNKLNELAGHESDSLHFIVNLSGGNAESYQRIRPNQRDQTFHRVINHLKYASSLRNESGSGFQFTLMGVINALNFRDLPELLKLAIETEAQSLWIKPMEFHGEETLKYKIKQEDRLEFAKYAKMVQHLSVFFGVNLFQPEPLHAIVAEHKKNLEKQENLDEFARETKKFLRENSSLKHTNLQNSKAHDENRFQPRGLTQDPELDYIPYKEEVYRFKLPVDDSSSIKYADGGFNASFYDHYPCYIGYQYLRILVSGQVLGCCTSEYPLANLANSDKLLDLWLSSAFVQFRKKMERISTEKFHRTEKEWAFCQQCAQPSYNSQYNALIKQGKS